MKFAVEQTDAVAVYISGAGPTIVAIVIDDDDAFGKQIRSFTAGLDLQWSIRKMHPHRQGAQIKLL
jgi:homoserine kinase